MKIILVLVIVLVVALTGCFDVEYPPRPIVFTTPATQSAVEITQHDDRYALRKFDITPRAFEQQLTVADGQMSVVFDFNSPQHYRIAITTRGEGVVALSSGDEVFGAFYIGDDEVFEYFMGPIYFTAGETELTFTVLRGVVRIDTVTAVNTVALSTERFHTASLLNHPDPLIEAIVVFEYLKTQFGQRILTAQHCSVNSNGEIDAVFELTGREPAVRFGDLAGVFFDGSTEVEMARQWREKGGIAGFTWKWRSPDGMGRGYYANETVFSAAQAVAGAEFAGAAYLDMAFLETLVESGEISISCKQVIADIDEVASVLAELAGERIPVLFNPLPDGGSRLYWWGASGGEVYAQLWRLMYQRLVNYHGLNNLIWIWDGGDYRYYPGDDYIDIIGESVFVEGNVGSQAVRLGNTDLYNRDFHTKPVMVSAGSALPCVDVIARDNACWLMWAVYKGDYVVQMGSALERFYNHELSICLDQLPSWS
jgi:mannan endo-1,4-beta-mannosidase